MFGSIEANSKANSFRNGGASSSRPKSMNIGALFAFNSAIGRAMKTGIEATVHDINSNSSILPGTKLNLILHDINCSRFFGMVQALWLMEKDMAPMIGPQSSGITHFMSQMYAIANLVAYYGWEEVTTIFVDDDYRCNGISVLATALAQNRAKITYKAAFNPGSSRDAIIDLLVQVNLMESRVFIVHAYQKDSLFAVKISTTMVQLFENGDLQRIHDKWLSQNGCSNQATQVGGNQLSLKSF
ncbi:hypothetical protein Ancab_008034 [Ancistrocladus abbreviatus]